MMSSKTRITILLKKVILYVFFLIEMILLYKIVQPFVESKKYFSISPDFSVPFLLIMIFSMWTISLISQTFTKKWEIFLTSVIFLITSFLFLIQFRFLEALIGSVIFSLFLFLEVGRTKMLAEENLSIRMRYSSRPATKAYLLAVSAVISLSIFLMSEHISSIDVGEEVANIVHKPVQEAVNKEYEDTVDKNINTSKINSFTQSNSQFSEVLKSLGITDIPSNLPLSENVKESVVGSIKDGISSRVNKIVEPYRKFFSPTLAILVFGLLQIYNTIAYFVYSNTIYLILFILRRTKFVTVEKVPAEREVLKF